MELWIKMSISNYDHASVIYLTIFSRISGFTLANRDFVE